MKRLISIFITLSILFTSSLVGIYAETSKDISESDTSTETQTLVSSSDSEKELSRPEESTEYVDFASAVSKEAKYADDSIIVTMKRGVKEANHVYTAKDFPELDVDYIEDLTYLTNEELLNDPEFMANYTQILQIHLKSSSEEKVLSSVGTLSKRSTTDVASAAPNYEMEVECCAEPNDSFYESKQKQYLDRINLPAAWSVSNGSKNVKVAVLDCGIVEHPDLVPNLSNVGYDAYNHNNITTDAHHSHGTMVAGIIGAKGNNTVGISGVAWDVTIVPIQLTGMNNGNEEINIESIVRTFTYLNNNNIPIANLSYSLKWDSQPSQETISNYESIINNYFGLLVVSAGNDGANLADIHSYPSKLSCNNIISVLGTELNNDNKETKATISNFNSTYVDIGAPVYCYSTTYSDVDDQTLSYSYREDDGTSYSAPYVTGVAALIKSIRPELSTFDIKNIILNNADTKSTLIGYCENGRFLNAGKALSVAQSYSTPEPQTFVEDVNYDTYDDLVYFREYNGKRHIQVFLGSNANHIGTPAVSPSTSDTTKCSVDTLTTDAYNESDVAFMGDVNGDHFMDMIVHSSTANKNRKFYVYLGQQNGKFSAAVTSTMSNMHDTSVYPCQLFTGDFNGDYKCDFLVHYRNTDGTRNNLVYLSNGDGTFATGVTSTSTRTYVATDEVKIIDINGDNKDDLVVHWALNGIRQFLVYKAYVNGQFSAPINVDTGHYHSSEFPCKFLVGNFNGDDFGDFYVWWKSANGNGNHIIYYGMANGRFDTGVSINTTLCYDENQQLFVGRVNSDTIDDVIMHWPDPTTGEVRLRVCFGGTTNALTAANTVNTSTTHVITGGDTVYRVHVGDFNGWGTDIITEIASSATAYRSTALVNLGTANGFQSATYTHKLRTYFYIDYN